MNELRLITAMITPFKENGEVDFKIAQKLALGLSQSGSDGILIGGTTGESPTLIEEEKLKLFSEVKKAVGQDITVIAGTTDNDTKSSVELSLKAQDNGADALLLTVPSYNKPTQEGLLRHFIHIADSVTIPGILYNVPGRTALNMDAETTFKLSRHKNIIGVKEACSDQDQISSIIKASDEDNFKVWSGNDDETFTIMSAGGYGVVSVASNIIGNQIKSMMTDILKGSTSSASLKNKSMMPLFKALFWVTNPILIKRALNISNFNVGGLRMPMFDNNEFQDEFKKLLSGFKIDVINS